MLPNASEFLAINANLLKIAFEGHSQGKFGICESSIKNLFSLDTIRSSQQLWSCRDDASVLWNFYPKLGCYDIKSDHNMYVAVQVTTIWLICMDFFLLGTTFLDLYII